MVPQFSFQQSLVTMQLTAFYESSGPFWPKEPLRVMLQWDLFVSNFHFLGYLIISASFEIFSCIVLYNLS
jgi:hypothetical protein